MRLRLLSSPSDGQFVCIFIVQSPIFCFSVFCDGKCGYGYSKHPLTGSLYAFLSSKVLFSAFPFFGLKSAGTAIVNTSDGQFVCIFIVQSAILGSSGFRDGKCGYGYSTHPRTGSLYAFLSFKVLL